MQVYTIGHFKRSLEELVAILKAFGIQTTADIRSRPGLLKAPSFNRENLGKDLPKIGMNYVLLPKLGGLRRSITGLHSPSMGLISTGLRAYADYVDTED